MLQFFSFCKLHTITHDLQMVLSTIKAMKLKIRVVVRFVKSLNIAHYLEQNLNFR